MSTTFTRIAAAQLALRQMAANSPAAAADAALLGLVITAVNNEVKELQVKNKLAGPDESLVIKQVEKAINQAREAEAIYLAATPSPEVATKLAAAQHEIQVLRTFLPQPLSLEEIANVIAQAIAQLPPTPRTAKDIGSVSNYLKNNYQGRYSPKDVAPLIKAALGL